MKLENIAYACFGNNITIGKHIRKQLHFLRSVLPAEMLNRHLDDLGCGDGKVTIMLKDILKPSRLRGYDIHKGNIRRAISLGIDAGNIDLDENLPQGELAIMWGVLHHLQNPERCIKKLKENYQMLIIREPIRQGFIKSLELGNPRKLAEIIGMFDNYLPGYRAHYCDGSVIAFYGCRDYLKKAYHPLIEKGQYSFERLKLYREPASNVQ